LPAELKNVLIQKYISSSQEPSTLGKILGWQRTRTGDEIISGLARGKEALNERFRQILREEGSGVQ
jgi:hypothetical protein